MNKIVLSAIVLSLLSACSSNEVKEQDKAPVTSSTPSTPSTSGAQSQGSATQGVTGAALNPLKDPSNILSKRDVFFDYDKYDVKDEFKPLVQAHAKYLSSTPSASVIIQGNCDERGSREYNIALGQRRAEAVRKMLNVLGVADKQIETVSFGEEKPRAACHDESCWKDNRRSDIVYVGE